MPNGRGGRRVCGGRHEPLVLGPKIARNGGPSALKFIGSESVPGDPETRIELMPTCSKGAAQILGEIQRAKVPDTVDDGGLRDDNCTGRFHCWVLIDDNNGRSETFSSLKEGPQDSLVVVSGFARDQGASDQTTLAIGVDDNEDVEWHVEAVCLCRGVVKDHISIAKVELSLDWVHPEKSAKAARVFVNVSANKPTAILALFIVQQAEKLNNLWNIRLSCFSLRLEEGVGNLTREEMMVLLEQDLDLPQTDIGLRVELDLGQHVWLKVAAKLRSTGMQLMVVVFNDGCDAPARGDVLGRPGVDVETTVNAL